MKKWITGGLILVIFLLVFVPGVYAEEQYQYVTQWGSEGIGNGEFETLHDIAVDTTDNIYVLDSHFYFDMWFYNLRRFQKFTSEGSLIDQWYSLNEGIVTAPSGIAVDSSGNVYITDVETPPRIVKIGPDMHFISHWGSYGEEDGEFRVPYDVAVDTTDMIYVADSAFENSRIQKFDSDGTFSTKWYVPHDYDSHLSSLAVDTQGNVYVLNSYHIQKFSSSGSLVKEWGSQGSGDGQFESPNAVAVDTVGNVYVADGGNSRIQKFTSEGTFVTKWGSEGSGDGEFNGAIGVAVDSAGNVYVLDGWNYRVQKFAKVMLPTPLIFDAKCPVDISITDPEGHTISKLVNEITGASYTETGMGSDNRPDVQVIIPDKKPGKYTITATARNGVSQSETFSLEVTSGGITQVIVQNFKVEDIQTNSFGIDVSSDGVITISGSGGLPTPEFPSAFLPGTMIIGFLGAVLLIQRTREH